MQFVNLTPHTINIGDIAIPPSGQVARVATESHLIGHVDGIPVYSQRAGEVTGLPEAIAGTIMLVSSMVRLAINGRRDVASPGDLIRDASGQPIGCTGIVMDDLAFVRTCACGSGDNWEACSSPDWSYCG